MKKIFDLNDFDLNKVFDDLQILCQPYQLNDITDEIIYIMNSIQFIFNSTDLCWTNEKEGVVIYQDDMLNHMSKSFRVWRNKK